MGDEIGRCCAERCDSQPGGKALSAWREPRRRRGRRAADTARAPFGLVDLDEMKSDQRPTADLHETTFPRSANVYGREPE